MSRRLLRTLLLVLAAIVGAVMALFLYRNAHWIVVRVPVLRLDARDPLAVSAWESPLWVLLVGSFVAGAAAVWVASLPTALRAALERQRSRKVIADLEAELSDLRNLPVQAPAPFEDLDAPDATEDDAASDEDDEAALLAAAAEPPRGGFGRKRR